MRTSIIPLDAEGRESNYELGEWTVWWKMVFTWQIPMMFPGYSFLCYTVGLTILACTPLIQRQAWGPESKVSGVASYVEETDSN